MERNENIMEILWDELFALRELSEVSFYINEIINSRGRISITAGSDTHKRLNACLKKIIELNMKKQYNGE